MQRFLILLCALLALAAGPASAGCMTLLGAGKCAAPASAWTPATAGARTVLWFDMSDGSAGNMTIVGGTTVSSLTNKGSLGGAAVQATGGSQPGLVATAINGNQALRFNSKTLVLPSVTLAPTSTLLICGVFTGPNSGNFPAGYSNLLGQNYNATTGWAIQRMGGSSQDWVSGDFAVLGNGYVAGRAPRFVMSGAPAWGLSSPRLIVARLGPTPALEINRVGVTERIATPGAFPSTTGAFVIGDALPNNSPWADGYVGELVVITDPTVDDLAGCNAYMARWGV